MIETMLRKSIRILKDQVIGIMIENPIRLRTSNMRISIISETLKKNTSMNKGMSK